MGVDDNAHTVAWSERQHDKGFRRLAGRATVAQKQSAVERWARARPDNRAQRGWLLAAQNFEVMRTFEETQREHLPADRRLINLDRHSLPVADGELTMDERDLLLCLIRDERPPDRLRTRAALTAAKR